VKNPSHSTEEPIQDADVKPSDYEEWRRKHSHAFKDFDVDRFLEGIYESKHRKLPDYMRTKK
jgi:hypothetical protein